MQRPTTSNSPERSRNFADRNFSRSPSSDARVPGNSGWTNRANQPPTGWRNRATQTPDSRLDRTGRDRSDFVTRNFRETGGRDRSLGDRVPRIEPGRDGNGNRDRGDQNRGDGSRGDRNRGDRSRGDRDRGDWNRGGRSDWDRNDWARGDWNRGKWDNDWHRGGNGRGGKNNWWGGNRGWYGYGHRNRYWNNWYYPSYSWLGWGYGYPLVGWGLGYGVGLGTGLGWGYGGWGGYGVGYDYYPYASSYTYSYPTTTLYADAPDAVAATPQAADPAIAAAGDFIAEGEQAFGAGQYEQALQAWRHAMVDDPDNGAVVLLMAQALFALGRYDDAANMTQMGMQMLPETEWGGVVKNYTQLYPNIGDYTTQIRAAETARKEQPDNGAIRFLLGYHFGYLNYPKQAVRELDKALEIEPRDVGSEKLRDIFAQQAGLPARAPTAQPPATQPPATQAPGALPDPGARPPQLPPDVNPPASQTPPPSDAKVGVDA